MCRYYEKIYSSKFIMLIVTIIIKCFSNSYEMHVYVVNHLHYYEKGFQFINCIFIMLIVDISMKKISYVFFFKCKLFPLF